MREYSYNEKWKKLLVPEVVRYIARIYEFKGKQRLIADRHADVLERLVEVAKIQSTESSNKIEGIFTSDETLKKLVLNKTTPKNRNECEIAGYRDVLNTIHESYQHIPVKSSFILQLHRDLYKFGNQGSNGKFKSVDNLIEEIDGNGNKYVRFNPVPAWETPESVERLCDAYKNALENEDVEPLLLIPMFILDFLCIHPFSDGNGRMSRLLTLLLLYKSGFYVGKYISIERLIETTKDNYYEVLHESSQNWHTNENDYEPFVIYILGTVLAAYREFMDQTYMIEKKDTPKPDRVAEIIREHIGPITKSTILELAPEISLVTVQRTIADLVKDERIIKIGGGRYTKYTWNWDKEDKA